MPTKRNSSANKSAVDPFNLPFPLKLTRAEREWFVLFAVAVAGKSAKQTERKMNAYFAGRYELTPFQWVKIDIQLGNLDNELRGRKFGQYARIEKAWRELVKLDVMKDLSVERLEAIPGIGPKTARFIMLYTDPNFDGVPLDTHILKFLATFYNDVPKSTPPAGKRYNELEARFQWAAQLRGKTVRELDTEVWKSYAVGQ